MSQEEIQMWDTRFSQDAYLFGTEPNDFLTRHAHLITPGGRVLAVADGEGRNGVWLAEQGFAVHAIEGSRIAIEKSTALAQSRSVGLASAVTHLEPGSLFNDPVDVMNWNWPVSEYDAVVAIFIQFAKPPERAQLFAYMAKALKPGGVLLLEGYHHRQMQYGTGGPKVLDQLYDEALLQASFTALKIESLVDYEVEMNEGDGHNGISSLIDLIARAQ
ncbi:MAG: class I SAM-dependent methyltransferase [Candidatus Nanopelagicales bacterium]